MDRLGALFEKVEEDARWIASSNFKSHDYVERVNGLYTGLEKIQQLDGMARKRDLYASKPALADFLKDGLQKVHRHLQKTFTAPTVDSACEDMERVRIAFNALCVSFKLATLAAAPVATPQKKPKTLTVESLRNVKNNSNTLSEIETSTKQVKEKPIDLTTEHTANSIKIESKTVQIPSKVARRPTESVQGCRCRVSLLDDLICAEIPDASITRRLLRLAATEFACHESKTPLYFVLAAALKSRLCLHPFPVSLSKYPLVEDLILLSVVPASTLPKTFETVLIGMIERLLTLQLPTFMRPLLIDALGNLLQEFGTIPALPSHISPAILEQCTPASIRLGLHLSTVGSADFKGSFIARMQTALQQELSGTLLLHVLSSLSRLSITPQASKRPIQRSPAFPSVSVVSRYLGINASFSELSIPIHIGNKDLTIESLIRNRPYKNSTHQIDNMLNRSCTIVRRLLSHRDDRQVELFIERIKEQS